VQRDGVPIRLSQKEFSILEYLMRHQGETVTKESILPILFMPKMFHTTSPQLAGISLALEKLKTIQPVIITTSMYCSPMEEVYTLRRSRDLGRNTRTR